MSEYRLDINGVMGLCDYSSISDYIEVVSTYDILTVTLHENNNEDLNMLCTILRNSNFNLEVRDDMHGKYYITACKGNLSCDGLIKN